jgi:hypothetical protein
MIKAAFDIVPSQQEWNNFVLMLEIGEKFLGCVWMEKDTRKILGLRQYHLEDTHARSAIEMMQDILETDELLSRHTNETVVIYNFSESNIVPASYFNADINKPLTEMVFGNANKGLILSERIDSWDLFNLYRIPRDIHRLVQQRFPARKYWHYYSIQMAAFERNDEPRGALMKIIFYGDKFIVTAVKDHSLHLVQTYTYETPEDVCYYLLCLCRILEVSQNDVVLKISGLIDEDSILYTDLLKYFRNIEWDGIPAGVATDGLLNEFPSHYFSPLVRMAACV